MTRIVRFEELNGELILRVPEDVAQRLGLMAGDEASLSDTGRMLMIERIDARKREQFEHMLKIIEEDDAVLAALAK